MPSRPPNNLSVSSIAFISSMAAVQLIAGTALADQQNTAASQSTTHLTITLPNMGNTIDLDRSLSREVSDTFIFTGDNTDSADTKVESVVSTPQPAQIGAASKPVQSNSITNAAVPVPVPENVEVRSADTITAIDHADQSNLDSEDWNPIIDQNTVNGDTVWQQIIEADRLPLAKVQRVQFYIDQYQRESMWISKILHRGSPFLAHMIATLDRRFMPVELALLPAIESGYLPTAKSRGNAVGLWQIVPVTAKEIGVTRNAWFDGRGDVLTSTTAAIDYLSYLNAEFDGDWELTLAAYNAGPGRVRAAMKRNAKAGLPTDYWSLALPRETLDYVPKLIALVRLIKMPDHGGLDMPYLPMEPAFESIDVGFRVSLDKVAQITDIDINQLRTLNAGLIHGVTAPQGPHYLLIPAGTGEQFQQAFGSVDRKTAFSLPNTHNVAAGDTISSIALKYGLSQSALLSMNGLDDTKIRIGQKLAIMDSSNLSESVVEYVVSIGDTLSEIARKFSVSVGDITLSTGESLSDDIIHPGDTLNIIVNTPTAG